MTVGQSYVDLGRLNIVVVILIATMKASLVVTFFMHLKWDNKFNALIFVATHLLHRRVLRVHDERHGASR